MDRQVIFGKALKQLRAKDVEPFNHVDVQEQARTQGLDSSDLMQLTPQWVGGELKRRADAGELILTEEGRSKRYSFPLSRTPVRETEEGMATTVGRLKGGVGSDPNGVGTAGNLLGLNSGDLPHERPAASQKAGGEPAVSSTAVRREFASNPENSEREKIAGRCAAWYNRLRQYAHSVLLREGLDMGSRLRREYFLAEFKDDLLVEMHNELKSLCDQHAPPISIEMVASCLRRLKNPKLNDILSNLTDEQRSFVERVEQSDDRRKFVRNQKLDLVRSFLDVTAAITPGSPEKSGKDLLNGLRRARATVGRASTRRDGPEAGISTPMAISTDLNPEDFRVAGDKNVVRERDELKQRSADLSRQVAELTEERDKLAAEKEAAEKQVEAFEGELNLLREDVKIIEGAWTVAFADVPDAAMFSSEGVTVLKQRLVSLESERDQAMVDRDEAQQAQGALQGELDDRPTAERLAGVREDLATSEECLTTVKAWRSFAWWMFGVSCAGLLIATIFAITGWSAQREAAQRAKEYYQAWQEATL